MKKSAEKYISIALAAILLLSSAAFSVDGARAKFRSKASISATVNLKTVMQVTLAMSGHGTDVVVEADPGECIEEPTAAEIGLQQIQYYSAEGLQSGNAIIEESGAYLFNGWYADEQLTEAADFSLPVTENTQYYSGWTDLHTLTFAMNGCGDQVLPIYAVDGVVIPRPSDPLADGYVFQGWFADEALTVPFDFHSAITESMTVYVSWAEEQDQEPDESVEPAPEKSEEQEMPAESSETPEEESGEPETAEGNIEQPTAPSVPEGTESVVENEDNPPAEEVAENEEEASEDAEEEASSDTEEL